MHLALLLEMSADGCGDRIAVGPRDAGITYRTLHDSSRRGAHLARRTRSESIVYLAENGAAFAVALFAAAFAGIPLVPVNYRLGREQLWEILRGQREALLIADESFALPAECRSRFTPGEWLAATATGELPQEMTRLDDGDAVALVLHTSGTTAAPKAALLRHRHLAAYVFSTVEFGGASDEDASLISVPPYHIAGVSNTISNVYAGRRIVHLPRFSATAWLESANRERITHALVVPTMLARIVETLEQQDDAPPTALRSIAYGGAAMQISVIERALRAFPDVDFVNAYGLTETSSTIAVLGPDEHRLAAAAGDDEARRRLSSVGRLVPGVEAEVRGPDSRLLECGEVGELFVRGDQVSGEYMGVPRWGTDGWFATRDRAMFDEHGYLFIEGRADDTIIRGGENVAPAEVEAVLRRHPAVDDAAVFGLEDDDWGERIAAAVVTKSENVVNAEELRSWVKEALRSSKTPDDVFFVDSLPHTETGKLLRRVLVQRFSQTMAVSD